MSGVPERAVLVGEVREASGGPLLPCWVEISQADGTIIDDWEVNGQWRGFPSDGTFRVSCVPGVVHIRIRTRLSHLEECEMLELAAGETRERCWTPRPWVPVRKLGLAGGESHDHLSAAHTPEKVVLYARAFGLRYINACQGWMHRKEDEGDHPAGCAIATRLERANTDDFALHFGAERPKTRYGHVWWINLRPFDDPFGEYMSWHDPAYVHYVDRNPGLVADIQAVCPLRNEPPLETWRRYRRQGAACVAAHPTSWWLNRPTDELIVPNISAELPFALLSGEAPDALAVMGYDPDQIFYQNLWFHLLNEGYLIAGCGETDGELRGAHHIGQINTWTRLPAGTPYSPAALAAAVRAGRSVMSSGPYVDLRVDDGDMTTGDRLVADGSDHVLTIEAWSAPEPDELLTWVVVYRNGHPWYIRDLRETPIRHIAVALPVRECEFAWYVVKAYGHGGPDSREWLDVMAYARRCETAVHTEYRDWTQVALTNPVYFLPPGWTPPAPVRCALDLRLVDAAGAVLPAVPVRVRDGERTVLEAVSDASGRVRGEAPPTAMIEIAPPGQAVRRLSIFLDYRPANACMESCYTGRWRQDHPALQPGQVPWEAFRLHDLRRALERVEWTITCVETGQADCSQ